MVVGSQRALIQKCSSDSMHNKKMRGSSRMVLRGRVAARDSIPLNSVKKYTHAFVPSVAFATK